MNSKSQAQYVRSAETAALIRVEPFVMPWWLALAIGRRPVRTLIRTAVMILLSSVLFGFILIPIRVTGVSMTPTYRGGGVNFANRLAYAWALPKRGDIVVVNMTGKKFVYLKRIVAMPGERVSIHQGIVVVDGRPLDEPYVLRREPWTLEEVQLKESEYLVIGDNRDMDQEMHEFGTVHELQILGKVLF